MSTYILEFQDIDRSKLMLAGGKGTNLGDLSKIKEIQVPEGFCVTTEAYKKVTKDNRELNSLLDELAHLHADERRGISEVSAKIRAAIESIPIANDIASEVADYVTKFGEEDAYAVRSSATAEDLPTASFAGQHDTYLNILGKQSILKHISKCWASLFSERAVIYRIQNGFNHRKVHLSVVVQKMVFPQAAGIMFTADPVTSNRKMLSIDASFGLGEALVAGLVNADNYKICNGNLIDKKIFTKKLAIYGLKYGGTKEQEIEPEIQNNQVLTDEEIVQLERIGRKIETHFGGPQDIEWCLVDGAFYIVQSRPITTLYPIPETNDEENHVYVSVGHQQMMTDPIRPLGLSFFKMTARRHMPVAGGRLFVDITQELASPVQRNIMVNVLGKSDPLIKGALINVLEREGFIKSVANDLPPVDGKAIPSVDYNASIEYDPTIVPGLIKANRVAIEELKQNIQTKTGVELFDFISDNIQKNYSNPQSFSVIMTGMNAYTWVKEKMNEWLGDKDAADIIAKSVPDNITSEMGLALMDVADVIRPYPEVIEYLQHSKDDSFLDELVRFKGGKEARSAIYVYLNKYGMRCAGEIDITRTRWSEKPSMLIPVILNNIKKFEEGAGVRRFEQGLQEALNKQHELLERLKELPDGAQKADEAKRMFNLIRNYSGYREYPKYGIVNRYFIYKQALLKEARELVQANVLHDKEDIYYLSFEELREVVRTHKFDYNIIDERKEAYKLYEKLTPPRVITSDGEVITGKYKTEDIPTGAIAGLAVSSGVVEGRARVILNMEDADIEDGDILVTMFTDPSWTPLFVSIKGLVTEVGGLMTHGAVIAREYGLPAVVGAEDATKLIKDGQRIRVNGTYGYVEVIQ